jgi:hypothetical protein
MGISINKVSGGSTPVVAPYKVFTGLLTQSGGDNPDSFLSPDNGGMIEGVTYEISDYQIGDDFTNIGAPNNANGVSFIATGRTAANWTGSTKLNYNTGAPICIVLENTLGNVWFGLNFDGNYFVSSNELFVDNKTLLFYTAFSGTNSDVSYSSLFLKDDSSNITLLINEGIGYLNQTPIEIRVYN